MSEEQSPAAPPETLPGRECGSCMLCCKLPGIVALEKPMGKWCRHATPGKGCGIYADRPQECRSFHCAWRLDARFGPDWKPDKARFFIAPLPDGNIHIMADPAAPGAWRDARYYPTIKVTAGQLMDRGKNLFVVIGRRIIVVLPERDVDVGIVPDGHRVNVRTHLRDGKRDCEIVVEPAPNWNAQTLKAQMEARGPEPTAPE